MLAPWKKSYDKPRLDIKKQRHQFANKCSYSQNYGFSSNHVWMRVLDHKEGWVLKNSCFWTVMQEKTLECPLGSKEIKQVNPKGNQPWIFIGRTDVEAESPILWPHDTKNWLIGKDPVAGKHWRWEEKWVAEDEIVGWHRWLDGHKHEQTLGDSEWQGKPVLLQFMGSQRVEHDWVAGQQQCSSEYELERYNVVLSVVLGTQQVLSQLEVMVYFGYG